MRRRGSRGLNRTQSNEWLDRLSAGLQKEVAHHEILVLDSRAGRNVAHRRAFHRRDANRVTTLPSAEGSAWALFSNPACER